MTILQTPSKPLPRTVAAKTLEPRLIGRVDGQPNAPTLLCLGGVHGNEPSGVLGLRQVLRALEKDSAGLVGTFVAMIGNRQALVDKQRFLSDDLNRHWLPDRVEALRATSVDQLEAEDRELVELDHMVRQLVETTHGPMFAMDLHTTSGEGASFVVLDDSLANREFALDIPVTVVVGLEEELSGTVTHYLDDLGMRVFGFEAGQHDDPKSVDRAAAAVWIALESSGVLEPRRRPEVELARRLLRKNAGGLPHVVEVRHRHPVLTGDRFQMLPGFENFQTVKKDDLLARDQFGDIRASDDGLILMPLYQNQGEDGFFLVHSVPTFWLELSKWLRRRGAQRILPKLPGVEKHPQLADTFVVDRKRARFFARELFHLLGYRRVADDERFLTMTRRHPTG